MENLTEYDTPANEGQLTFLEEMKRIKGLLIAVTIFIAVIAILPHIGGASNVQNKIIEKKNQIVETKEFAQEYYNYMFETPKAK